MREVLHLIPLRLAIVATAAAWLIAITGSALADATQRSIAVADFSYVDTSGEQRDQSRDHAARLAAFIAALKVDLAAGRTLRVVALDCGGPCRIADMPASELLAAARNAGADILLIGGIHKMSTLVQWAQVQAIDVKSDAPLMDKLFTFRGDTDEAWQRAEAFIVGELSNIAVPRPAAPAPPPQ